MTKYIKAIFNQYPNVKNKYEGEDIMLSTVENVFYKLVLFFQEPNKYAFELNLIYAYLNENDLAFAIKSVVDFFHAEKELKGISLYDSLDKNEIYNAVMFANYLTNNGINYSSGKLRMYYERGIIPNADTFINGVPHWFENTVKDFTKKQKKTSNKSKNKPSY